MTHTTETDTACDDICRLDDDGRCTRPDHDHSDGHPFEQTPQEKPRLRVVPGHCDCPASSAPTPEDA